MTTCDTFEATTDSLTHECHYHGYEVRVYNFRRAGRNNHGETIYHGDVKFLEGPLVGSGFDESGPYCFRRSDGSSTNAMIDAFLNGYTNA